jgi:hypothetical protein
MFQMVLQDQISFIILFNQSAPFTNTSLNCIIFNDENKMLSQRFWTYMELSNREVERFSQHGTSYFLLLI